MENAVREKALVSIVIPVYNLQDRLEACIESVTRQTYRSLEIILVDDGSTDHSYAICQKYARDDDRILAVHQANQGVSAARNLGIKKAGGTYIMFIDGDDTAAPDYVETYVSNAQTTGADVVIGGVTRIEQGKESRIVPRTGVFGEKEFLSILCRDGTVVYGYVCSKLYLLSLIRENEILFDEKMRSQEDLDFALSVYGKARLICGIDDCGYYYRYAPSDRKPNAEAILGNQVKLYHAAEAAGADTGPLFPRFQSMLYTWLYHADSEQAVKDLINMELPDILLRELTGQRREVKNIIRFFREKKAGSIYRYFSVRGILRNVLLKLRAARPGK